MDAGDVKIHHGGVLVFKLKKLCGNVNILEVVEFACNLGRDSPGCGFQVIVDIQLVLVENLENCFAAVAAKSLFLKQDGIGSAIRTAMITIWIGHISSKKWVNFPQKNCLKKSSRIYINLHHTTVHL